MEQFKFIETKKAGNSPKTEELTEGDEHAEAVALVEKHRDFFEHYAKGRIKIEPAPKRLPSFAFNLEENTIYINSMFYKKLGLSEDKTVFATLHEIEHFMEKLQILSEDGGEKVFDKFLKRIKTSKAFSLMDNCVADIRENRAVVSKTNKGMGELETKIYKEDLFVETNFTSQPRHIQFSQALLRESRVSGEKCEVSSDVRIALDEVARVKDLMEIMTNPETPMSMRLKLQDKYIWPKVEALLEKDMEDKKKQKEEEREKEERGDEKGGSNEQGDEKSDKKEGQEGGEEEKKGKDNNDKKSEKGKSEKKDGDSGEEKVEKVEEGGGEKDETDPNKVFANEYAEAEKRFPEAVPVEEIEKALKEWKEAQKGKDSKDKADDDYAKNIGVEKTDLQNYRKIVETLEKMVNPETDVSVIEELRNLFSRIISKRLKKAQMPKYPVEEGDELVDPAQLVADVKSGNLEPKVWEDTEIKEKKGDRFGEVEITLVCDQSGSMGGIKAEEQRKSAVLVMEVLKEFVELCKAEKINVDKPLEVKSEIYSFADSSEDKTPLKKMSTELGEAERINVLKKLYKVSGTTTDFNCLEAIDARLDDKTKIKIKIGELKKIVIVFTDGGSDNPARVQGVLKSLRDAGVVAIGVGITSEGAPVMSTYDPNALVVEEAQKLPIILGELLKEHLKDL